MFPVSELACSGFEIRFKNDIDTVRQNGRIVIFDSLLKKLYLVDTSNTATKSSSNYSVYVNVCLNGLAFLKHLRLGNTNKDEITRMVRDRPLPNLGKVE